MSRKAHFFFFCVCYKSCLNKYCQAAFATSNFAKCNLSICKSLQSLKETRNNSVKKRQKMPYFHWFQGAPMRRLFKQVFLKKFSKRG